MKRLNEYFDASEDADYKLDNMNIHISKGRADVRCGGSAVVRDGGRADVWDGGHAVVLAGGHAVVWDDGHAVVRDGGRAVVLGSGSQQLYSTMPILAESESYELRRSDDGLYYAGCQSMLTAAEALKHWDREDDRACLFTMAIGMIENAKEKP